MSSKDIKVGDKLKEARNNAGLSQKKVSDITGFSNTSISNWEKGVSRPDVDSFGTLCALYDVNPNDFFVEEKSEAKKKLESDIKIIERKLEGASDEKREQAVNIINSTLDAVLANLEKEKDEKDQ